LADTDPILKFVEQTPQNEREAIYLACWGIAFRDGRLWREAGVLLAIAEELGLDKKTAKKIEKAARRGKRAYAKPKSDTGQQVLFHFAIKTAAADGKLDDNELQVARKLGKNLGIDDDQIHSSFKQLIPKHDRPKTRRENRTAGFVSGSSTEELLEGLRLDVEVETNWSLFKTYIMPFLLMVLSHTPPVLGAMFWDWDISTILLLYWMENVLIGFFTMLKISRCQESENYSDAGHENVATHWPMVYGIFMAVHGFGVLLITALSIDDNTMFLTGTIIYLAKQIGWVMVAFIPLVFEQWYAYRVDFLGEEKYNRGITKDLISRPYSRVAPMHVVIVLGGGAVALAGWVRAAPVLLMVGLHLFIECLVWAHQLPEKSYLKVIRHSIGGAVVGAGFAGIPLVHLSLFGSIGLGLIGSFLSWGLNRQGIHFDFESLSAMFVWWLPGTVVISILIAGFIGSVMGFMDALGRFGADAFVDGARGKTHGYYLAALFIFSGIINAFIPYQEIGDALSQ